MTDMYPLVISGENVCHKFIIFQQL